MKQKELTLFRRDCYTDADYKEWCEDNNEKYDENDTYAFYEWESQMEQWDFEDMLDNCKYSKLKDNAVVIVGSLGLWYGRRDITPTKCENFADAIYKCMGGCAEIQEVVKKGNRIDVTTAHHDGRNYYSIFFLTEIGADRLDRNGTISVKNRENIMKLPEYLWY